MEQRLPWWTWLVPMVVCHLGTQAALYFQFAPGVSISYWPIPFALVLTLWWGPRALKFRRHRDDQLDHNKQNNQNFQKLVSTARR